MWIIISVFAWLTLNIEKMKGQTAGWMQPIRTSGVSGKMGSLWSSSGQKKKFFSFTFEGLYLFKEAKDSWPLPLLERNRPCANCHPDGIAPFCHMVFIPDSNGLPVSWRVLASVYHLFFILVTGLQAFIGWPATLPFVYFAYQVSMFFEWMCF